MKVIIAGAGQIGRLLAGALVGQGADVVLIDPRRSVLARAEESLDVMTLEGDATHRDILRKAGAQRARGFVAVTHDDQTSLLAAALARDLGAAFAVARVDDPRFYDSPAAVEHGVLGVDHVLCMGRLACSEMLDLVTCIRGGFAASFASHRLQVSLWPLTSTAAAVGRTAQTLAVGDHITVGGVVRDGFVLRPEDAGRLEDGDGLVVAGERSVLDEIRPKLLSIRTSSVLIAGAGEIGTLMADHLGRAGAKVHLVDIDPEQCERRAAEIQDVAVLCGDATNPELLADLRIETIDDAIAVTREDEVNLLTILLVRQLSSARTYMVVHRPEYAGLCRKLGIEGTVSKYEALTAEVLRLMTPEREVVAQQPIPGTSFHVVELRLPTALRTSGSRPTTVGELPLPAAARTLAVVRGARVAVPRPSLRLEGGESLIMLCPVREVDRAARRLHDLAERPHR